MRRILTLIFEAAGEQAPKLKNSMLLGVLTAILRGVVFSLFIPLFFALSDGNQPQFWSVLSLMTSIVVGLSITDWISRGYDYNGHAAYAGDALRRSLGEHLRLIPLEELYKSRSGSTAATLAGNVDDVVNYTGQIGLMLISAIVTPAVVGLIAIYYDWRLGLALLLLFPAVIPIYFKALPVVTKNKMLQAEAASHLNAETIEYTQGLAVLKSTRSVGSKANRFIEASKKMEVLQNEAMKEETPANLALGSIIEIGMLAIVGLGLWFVSHGDIKLMLVAALMVAIIRFAEPLTTFISLMSSYELVRAGYDRLGALLAIKPLDLIEPTQVPDRFDIAFEDVTFSYRDKEEKALKSLTLQVPSQALTALVGPSGCGKTTLTRLMMRYADPQQGRVTIGGIDLRQIEPTQLNRLIAVVFQDVYLFDDSIFENIKMGRPDATEQEVFEAAKLAQCHDFIQRLPDGYNTNVGELGSSLSGGEKQRISIARAFLKDAPIIILDEPTAALDTYSELAVQSAINRLVQDKTVIVIAHRLSTIVAADQIVVLKDGQLHEIGSHSELLSQKNLYAKLWEAQHQDLALIETDHNASEVSQ